MEECSIERKGKYFKARVRKVKGKIKTVYEKWKNINRNALWICDM